MSDVSDKFHLWIYDILWYMLIYDGTGSVEGDTGWYLVVLGQYRAVQVDI